MYIGHGHILVVGTHRCIIANIAELDPLGVVAELTCEEFVVVLSGLLLLILNLNAAEVKPSVASEVVLLYDGVSEVVGSLDLALANSESPTGMPSVLAMYSC